MDPATTKFLNARPYAVLPISPALAALYASHSSSTERSPHWCSKCGSYLLKGGSHVRIVRLKSRKGQPSSRALRTVCQNCQHRTDVTVEHGGTKIDAIPSNNLISPAASSISSPSIPMSHLSTPSSGQGSSAQGKARNKKKKSGLQLLLLKNREKEMQERKSNTTSGGLAAFLDGL